MADWSIGQVVEAACDGKERFESAALAHRISGRRKDRRWNIYRCRFCGFYHAGAALRRAERPRRRFKEDFDDDDRNDDSIG